MYQLTIKTMKNDRNNLDQQYTKFQNKTQKITKAERGYNEAFNRTRNSGFVTGRTGNIAGVAALWQRPLVLPA